MPGGAAFIQYPEAAIQYPDIARSFRISLDTRQNA
jgi:hypothetical protein